MLHFKKVDEVYFYVYPHKGEENDDLVELQKEFSVEHPERFYMDDYKKNKWDGTVKFIKFVDKTRMVAIAPVGLFLEIFEYLRNRNIKFIIDDNDYGIKDLNLENFDEYVEQIQPENKKMLTPERYYQVIAAKTALEYNRSILELTTGAGKSLILYAFIRYLFDYEFEKGEKFLLVVPSTDLVEQMYDDFIEYGIPEKAIKRIYSGKEKVFKRPIVISTWQSLFKYDFKFFEQFSGLAIDEVHRAKGVEISRIAENCINARFRLGTSGTVYSKKKDIFKYFSITAFLGMPFTPDKAQTNTLIETGVLTDFYVRHIVFNWVKMEKGKPAKFKIENFNYNLEYDMILESQKRKEMIINYILNFWKNRDVKKSTFLILSKRVKYVEEIYAELVKRLKSDKDVQYIHGQIKTEKRKEILAYIKEHGGLVSANVDILGTGVNIPNVSDVFFVNPIKSDILLLQSIGRSVRRYDGKSLAKIHDFVDKIPVKGVKENTVYSWLTEKKKLYVSKQYKFDVVEVDLMVNRGKKSIDEIVNGENNGEN